MKKTIILIFGIFLAISVSDHNARANDNDDVSFATVFFNEHFDFYFSDPMNIKEQVSLRFFAALEKEFKCIHGELCAIDAVPWSDAQDGDVCGPVEYQSKKRDAINADVEITLYLCLGEGRKLKRSVILKLNRASKAKRWLLVDFITPSGGSLLLHLEKWHKEYGLSSGSTGQQGAAFLKD